MVTYLLLAAAIVFGFLIFMLFRLGGTQRGMLSEGRATGRRLRLSSHAYQVEDANILEEDDPLSRASISRLEALEQHGQSAGKAISIQVRLKYADLSRYPAYLFSIAQIVISVFAFVLARRYLGVPLQILSLATGPVLVNWIIDRRIAARASRFDQDFPQFLLAVVGMLKIGFNSFQALEAAAEGLEEDSLVRQEVALMLERLRVGVDEDRSIGSFAEDILHPEVELFVQAVILSRRLGGTLSDTLDRLSKQVRKRQNFRMTASSAVTQQRGSIWVIIGIIVALELYMYQMAPAMVLGAWTNPSLRFFSELAVALIIVAIWLMNKITRIKV